MALAWIDVLDTGVKIGLGALISAMSGYVLLAKTQFHDESKDARERFYDLQAEKKHKYVEFLAQSQELIQTYLYATALPDSEEYKRYLRAFNEVQIISNDELRVSAFCLMSGVSDFIFLRKNEQEPELIVHTAQSARNCIATFQKLAQSEVTSIYKRS